MSNTKVTLFLMSYNRLKYFRESLDSLLRQDYPNAQVVISDNSTNDEVEELCREHYPNVEYRRRIPSLKSHEHFNLVLSEVKTDAFIIFHDDDVMMENCVSSMVRALDENPAVSAVGANAFFLNGNTFTKNPVNTQLHERELISDPIVLLTKYMSIESGCQPFPGYLYRASMSKGLVTHTSEGGKYSDLALLLKQLKSGPIFWIPERLLYYRVHSNNDSALRDIPQLLKLVRYLGVHYQIYRKSYLAESYLIKNYLLVVRKKGILKTLSDQPFFAKSLVKRCLKYFIKYPKSLFYFARRYFVKLGSIR